MGATDINEVLILWGRFIEVDEDPNSTPPQKQEAKKALTDAEAKLTPADKKIYNRIKTDAIDLENLTPDWVKHFQKPEDIKIQRIFLRGYLGRAYQYLDEDPQHYNFARRRVYLSPDLNSYVEFDVADLLFSIPSHGGLDDKACNIWLRAKCPKKKKDGSEVSGGEEVDIDLSYGGHGYELGQTKHYIDGDMMGRYNNGGATLMGCGPQTPTCPGKGCGPQTPTCPGKGCDAGNDLLGDKYATVVACDDWDFRKGYNPY